nr:hypothetical protein [Lentibacillus sp. JNUCC-1]
MDLEKGDHVHFFLKIYGGIPTAHPNYFLGVGIDEAGEDLSIKDKKSGILFYFNEADAWFLDQYDMEVVREEDEVNYYFHEK